MAVGWVACAVCVAVGIAYFSEIRGLASSLVGRPEAASAAGDAAEAETPQGEVTIVGDAEKGPAETEAAEEKAEA